MRQSQQNKNRMRGRGGRKAPNPMNRNYESNGPDVKIRGNAAHIAEKYATLARDAQGSGDRVMAENYLQHAEHYNRLIAAANAQMNAARNENQPDIRQDRDNDDDADDSENGNAVAEENASAQDDGENDRRARNPRNNRRQRKPRNASGEDNSAEGSSDAAGGEDEAPAASSPETEKASASGNGSRRRTSRKAESADDSISADAAGLPDSILGGKRRENPAELVDE